jgi:hypothetical protein
MLYISTISTYLLEMMALYRYILDNNIVTCVCGANKSSGLNQNHWIPWAKATQNGNGVRA